MKTHTVSVVARLVSGRHGVTVAPHVISDLFYKRYLDDQRCPVVGRVRLIPEDYIEIIEDVLRQRGLLEP